MDHDPLGDRRGDPVLGDAEVGPPVCPGQLRQDQSAALDSLLHWKSKTCLDQVNVYRSCGLDFPKLEGWIQMSKSKVFKLSTFKMLFKQFWVILDTFTIWVEGRVNPGLEKSEVFFSLLELIGSSLGVHWELFQARAWEDRSLDQGLIVNKKSDGGWKKCNECINVHIPPCVELQPLMSFFILSVKIKLPGVSWSADTERENSQTE